MVSGINRLRNLYTRWTVLRVRAFVFKLKDEFSYE